jgi:uncharacterized phage protein (TIGR01671 family)
MREIKFRAWEKNLKEIIPIDSIDFEHKLVNMDSAWRFLNEVELIQYTGLKDKNGKEIYEGDILEREIFAFEQYRTFIGAVKMFEGSWWIDSGTGAVSLWNEMHELKVIGNIYEHPELMEVAE